MTRPPDATLLMRWAGAASRAEEPEDAAHEVAEALAAALGDGPVDLVLLFFTAPVIPGIEAIVAAIKRRSSPVCIAGVSGGSVIGGGHEIESGPALTAVAARMPGVEVKPFVLVSSAWGEAIEDPLEFARHTPGADRAELVILF